LDKPCYGVVIPARNAEPYIKHTIVSIKWQTLSPKAIIVVDDSSDDRTAEVAMKLGAQVLRLNRRSKASATATPYLAYVINQGLNILKHENIDYLMLSGSDCVYPKNYVERLIKYMIRENVVLASGVILGEYTSPLSVRGSGRIIYAKWLKSIGFKYPINYGFESWLIFKALSQGLKVKVYRDLKFISLRKTSFNIKKAYLYGKAMKALGYTPLYMFIRTLFLAFTHGLTMAKYMMIGYLKHDGNTYNDLFKYTKKVQSKIIASKLKIISRV